MKYKGVLRSRAVIGILFFCLLSGISGCGYTTRSMIATRFRSVYVQPFENKVDISRETDALNKYKIYRPLLETDITKAVSNKYLFDGNLRPVRKELADVILKGELIEYRRDPLRYDDNDEVSEYRISLIVNIILWDRNEDKVVWEENGFTGDYTYFPTNSSQQNVTTKSDAQAVNEAIDDLAARIVARTVEEW